MSIFRNMTVRSAGILFVLSLLSGCPVPDGSLTPVCCVPPPVNPADVIGFWKMVSYIPPGGSAVDVSSYNVTLVSNAFTYTTIEPLAIPNSPDTPCTEYGTWSVAGNNLTTTPIAGSTCGNTASTQTLSVSGTTMTMSDAEGTAVFQRQTASPVSGSVLVGTWKMMAAVNAGTVTPMNQISATLTFNASIYSMSLPNCTETGTWSVSGNTLSFAVDPTSTCGSSPTYTPTVSWNDPLLTLSLTTQNAIWQKQLNAPASPVATGSGGAVDVSWQAVSGANSYKVYRGTASGAFATKTLLGSVGTTSLQDVTAVPGTPYYYQVTAVGTFGESAPSVEVSGTATAPPPSPVTGLTATPGTGQVTLAWNAVSGADYYNIYQNPSVFGICRTPAPSIPTGDYSLTGLTYLGWVAGPTALISPLTAGDCYQFMVTAVNGGGESLSMSYVDVTPN